MDDTASQRLGTFIRERREQLGIGLNELARRTKTSQSALSKLERGQVEAPAPHRLQAIARELGLDYEDLAAFAWYVPKSPLPALPIYLRQKYHDLTPDEIRQVDTYVEFLRHHHDDTNTERGKK